MRRQSNTLSFYFFLYVAVLLTNKAYAQNLQAHYDSAMVLISLNHSKEALSLFQQVLQSEPDFKDTYEHFCALCFYYRKRKLLVQTLQALIKKHPFEGKYYLDLAGAFFRNEKTDQADSILSTIALQNIDYSKSNFDLLEAKICFFRNNDAEGQKYYERAISGIESFSDNKALFKDIIYIISDEEFASYDSVSFAEKAKFYNAFWKRRDPTPFTKLNERIPEHFRRQFYARKHNRKFISGTIRRNPLLYENEYISLHEEDYTGLNPFEKLDLPRGMLEQTDIDDQGCIYIRHGKPDDWESSIGNTFQKNDEESKGISIYWKYHSRGDIPAVIYFFCATKEGWFLLSHPISTVNLEMLNARFWKMSKSAYWHLIENNKSAIQENVFKETTKYDYDCETYEFPFTFLNFKNDDHRNLVELQYALPLDEFKPDKAKPEKPITFEKGITVFDKDWNQLDLWQKTDEIATASIGRNWREQLTIHQKRYLLKPDTYHFAIRIRDLNSKKLGLYKGPLCVKQYSLDSLMLSDVLLASRLSAATARSRFVKDNVQYIPKFTKKFKRKEPVAIYYEIYNLGYNADGRTDYEINYSIWPYKKEKEIENPKNKKPVISTGVKQSGRQRDEKVWMSFDMSDHKKGKYVIEILVRDKLTGERVRKLIPVELK